MQREKTNNKIFFGNISFCCCCCKYINIDLTPTTMTTTAERTSTAMQLHDNLHIDLFSLSISLCVLVYGCWWGQSLSSLLFRPNLVNILLRCVSFVSHHSVFKSVTRSVILAGWLSVSWFWFC